MTEHIKRSHNKSLLLYHAVFPVRYRRKIFTEAVTESLKTICSELEERYEIHFLEIGTDEDHVHFLIQSVPTFSPSTLVQTIKSVTAREIFRRHPEIRRYLWGGKLWTSGYYINTAGAHGSTDIIATYVRNQGRSYQQLHHDQPTLFSGVV